MAEPSPSPLVMANRVQRSLPGLGHLTPSVDPTHSAIPRRAEPAAADETASSLLETTRGIAALKPLPTFGLAAYLNIF